MTTKPEAFDHRITGDQAALIPDEIRADPDERRAWVDQALEFGLKAMLQTAIGVDTAAVGKEFKHWSDGIRRTLVDPDSDLYRSMEGWVNNADGAFQRTLNVTNPSSPLKKFLDEVGASSDEHQEAITDLLKELKKEIGVEFEGMRNHLGIEAAVKEEAEKGTQKGTAFEEEICDHMNANRGPIGDAIGVVGTMLIDGTPRKVGDVMVEVDGPASSDLKLIIEAKAGKFSMTGQDSLPDQMKTAMDLRKARASIAVVDIKHLPKRIKPYHVIDNRRILVAVDRDAGDFTMLDVAFQVLRHRLLESVADRSTDVMQRLDAARVEELINEMLSALEITRKVKRNCTDASKMIEGLRSDITNLETDISTRAQEILGLFAAASAATNEE